MNISDRSIDPFTHTWNYVVEISNSEIASAAGTEAAFTMFMRGVMQRIEDQVVTDLYPQIREAMLAHYLTPEAITEEISKGIRARMAAQLFPQLEG